MGSMVKTYMMLCVAGLTVTICILMVTYNGDGSDAKDIVIKVASTAEEGQPNPLRGIKGAAVDDQAELKVHHPDKEDDYSDDDDEEDDEDNNAFSSFDSSEAENAWLDQEKKLMEKPNQGDIMKPMEDEDKDVSKKFNSKEISRTSNIRIVSDDRPQVDVNGGMRDKNAMQDDGAKVPLSGDALNVNHGDLPLIRRNKHKSRSDIPIVRGHISPIDVKLNQSSLQLNNDKNLVAFGGGADGDKDFVEPQSKTFKIMENGDLVPMTGGESPETPRVVPKAIGDSPMVGMRISGTDNKFKTKYDGGVQDLLRHADQLTVKEVKRECQPKNNIVMVKTHKCSSSTMQNILLRWGEDHNLTFAFPRSGVYLGSPSPFSWKAVMESNDGHYNIICNHMVYNQKAIEELMPSDSVYIGLLRNPTTQYESMYNYYRFDGRYRVTLEHFLKRPRLYFESEPRYTKQVGRNPMLFDIGLDATHMEKGDKRVTQYISQLAERFDLILIAEYFKESLILLKDILCWDLDDVVFFNQNARSKNSVRPPTALMKARISAWNSGDHALYQYFNRTLWKKIEAFGYERMAREVAELDRRNAELSQECIGATKQAGDSRMYYPPGVHVKSFVLKGNARGNKLCDQMTRPELTYIGMLRQKQIDRDMQRMMGR